MDSQAIALVIAAGGLVLGLARLAVSILSYRLDATRHKKSTRGNDPDHDHEGERLRDAA